MPNVTRTARTGLVVEKVGEVGGLPDSDCSLYYFYASSRVICRICLRSAIAISPHVALRWRGCRARWRSWSWHEKIRAKMQQNAKEQSSQTSDHIQTVLAAHLAVNMHSTAKLLWYLVLGCEHVNPFQELYKQNIKVPHYYKFARVDYLRLSELGQPRSSRSASANH